MDTSSVIRLAIGPHETRVSVPQAGGGLQELQLPIGAAHPGIAWRRHPPTPVELEEAIAAVEDVIMPLARQLPRGTRLLTRDGHARHLLAWLHAGPSVGLDDVERAFAEMAAVALGRPASASTLPADAAFDGWLLVLREVMHHCAFDRLDVEAP